MSVSSQGEDESVVFTLPFHPVPSTEAYTMVSFCVDLDAPVGALMLAGSRQSFLPAVRRGDEDEAGPQAWLLQPQLQPPA